MGVKGLYSYLSNEPLRFGRRVKLQDVPKHSGFIFFDGPALHFHLLNSFWNELVPSTEDFLDVDYFGNGIVSPTSVFHAAKKFFEYLLSTVECNICVVFDGGISSKYKEDQQLYRMREAYLRYDQAVESFLAGNERKNSAVPHIFSEDAILEALQLIADTRIEVYHSKGEAEIFISKFADNLGDVNILVISSDSDCLILPSIPGFVPLQSLSFTADGLEGWEYTKTQFLSSHPGISDNNPNKVFENLSCIAALCGCDYTLSTHLQRRIESARSVILRSNIGGLRQRDRTNPSAKCVVLSVIRYVSHFKFKFQKDWYHEMLFEIARSEKDKSSPNTRQDDLHEALSMIQLTYKGDEENIQQSFGNTVELDRIIATRKIYCKPVIELFETTRSNKQPQVDDMIKCYPVDPHGIWMEYSFSTCRDRIYSYLAHFFPEIRNATITEFKRRGGMNHPSIVGVEKVIKCTGTDFEECEDTTQIICRLCSSYWNVQKGFELCHQFECLPLPLRSSLLPALMLRKESHVLLLFFMMHISTKTCHLQDSIMYPENRLEFIQALGACTLAVVHTKLARDAIRCSSHITTSLDYIKFDHTNAFCHRKAVLIWNAIDAYGNTVGSQVDAIIEALSHCNHFRIDTTAHNVNLLWSAWCCINLESI